jgi:phosphonate transport system substrate-binding protein
VSPTTTTVDPRSDWPDPLILGVVPSVSDADSEQGWEAFVAALEDQLGVDVELRLAASYAGIIEGMIAGHVHFSQMGAFSFVLAENNGADISTVAVLASAKDTPDPVGAKSIAITLADNGEVNSVTDFAGKDTCFVDAASTSGYLFPLALLNEHGLGPDDINLIFAGGHDTVFFGLIDGSCEVGFLNELIIPYLVGKELIEGDEVKILDDIFVPGPPMALINSLPQNLFDELTAFIVRTNAENLVTDGYCSDAAILTDEDTGAQTCRLSGADIYNFRAADNSFYDTVRAVCKVAQTEACETG